MIYKKRVYFITGVHRHDYLPIIDLLEKAHIGAKFLSFDYQRILKTDYTKNDFLFFGYPQPSDVYEMRYWVCQKLAKSSPVTIINKDSYLKIPFFNKLVQKDFFKEYAIPTAPYYYFTHLGDFFTAVNKIKLPIVIKKLNASQGREIKIAETKDELLAYLSEKKLYEFFLEDIIKSPADIKAFIGKNDFYYLYIRPSIFADKKSYLLSQKLRDEIKIISQKIQKYYFLDYAGIDFLVDAETPYVLEINRSPKPPRNPEFAKEFIKIFDN